MSQWTHFLGIIRYDSMNQNVFPIPRGQRNLVNLEADLIHNAFHWGNIPCGSEGPLEIETIVTGRGPTVVITGDLRDFGKGNLQSVVDWINECHKNIKAKEFCVWVRDAFISCEVEFLDKQIVIEYNVDNDLFELVTYLVKENYE